MRHFLFAVFALLGLAASASATATSSPITYAISLSGSGYSAASNTTTFTYAVTSNPGGGPAISHWVLNLTGSCAGASAVVSTNDSLASWTNSDPTTSVAGLKFDTGYNDQETRQVTLTLAGQWSTGPVTIAVKSGNGFVLGTVQGPVCGAVVAPVTHSIQGTVFFDPNYNGTINADEPGLPGFTVTLTTAAGASVATAATSSTGSYLFSNLTAGDYYVTVTHTVPGLSSTTMVEHPVKITNADVTAPVTGYALHFQSLAGMTANGFTIGFWKNNLEKAASGKTNGVQLSATTLAGYTATVATAIPLPPFSNLTSTSAIATLSATGSLPTALLSKQLLASEYNFANGAYLNGNRTLTYLFLYQGEYVLKNAANYSTSYLLWLKNYFDAYNNTHGGALVAPAAL